MSCCGNCAMCNPDYVSTGWGPAKPPPIMMSLSQAEELKRLGLVAQSREEVRDGHVWYESDGVDVSVNIVPSQAEMMTDSQLQRHTKMDAIDESGSFVFSPEQSEQAIKYFQELVDAETGLPPEAPYVNEAFPGMSYAPVQQPMRVIKPQWSLAGEYAVKYVRKQLRKGRG